MKKLFIIFTFIAIMVCAANASDPIFTGIVASKSILGVTSNFNGTPIYTPDSDAMLRVSACIENSSHIGGANITVNWTDVFGTAQSTSFSASSSGTFCNSAFVFRDKANNAITIDGGGINPPGGVGSADIYVTVERLQ